MRNKGKIKENNMQESRKYIGSFVWPFIRYDVLMPQQIRTDLFEWLYLSLVVQQNDERKLDARSYTKEVKDEVRRIIKQKFSSLLDDVTIDNIISKAEREFIVRDEVQRGCNSYLSNETFGFLDTYEDLFSSQVSVQRVLQDGICGGIVPCFKDNEYLKEASSGEKLELKVRIKDKPTQDEIKKAYLTFNRLSPININNDDIEETEDFYDEDAEVDFMPQTASFEENLSEKDKNPTNNFSTHFLENTRCEYKLEVSVFTDGENLFIDTPFDPDLTLKWMNKRLAKARSVSEELDKYLQKLELEHNIAKHESRVDDTQTFIYRKGVAEQLTKFGDVYRLVEHLPVQYDDLKKLLIEIDKEFTSKHISYYNSLGRYLECLMHQFVDRTDIQGRQYFDYRQFYSEVLNICKQLGVNGRPFFKDDIFKHWQRGWEHFKADLVSLFLANSKMRNNSKLYFEFAEDAFDLYESRNNGSHYKQNVKYYYDEADVDKLFNVTRAFIELI